MTLLLLYLALALVVSFTCSVLEAVLLSVTPSFVSMQVRNGRHGGELLQELKQDIDRPLSALLSFNTIAHTVGAAGVGAQAQVVFGNEYVTATSVVLTLLILVFSEIIPKTLGANYWRTLAPLAARLLRWMIILLYPLVLLSMGITRLLERGDQETTFSREEFRAMAEVGAEEGVFHERESRFLRALLQFGNLRAADVLTPRVVVTALPESATIDEALEWLRTKRFSRLPVYREDREHIVGYVLLNDVLLASSRDQHDRQLSDLTRDVLTVPETISLHNLFDQLLERRNQLAVVRDEYGGFAGIVTLEDIVETLLGLEITDERDRTVDMRELARRRWLERAKARGVVSADSEPGDLHAGR